MDNAQTPDTRLQADPQAVAADPFKQSYEPKPVDEATPKVEAADPESAPSENEEDPRLIRSRNDYLKKVNAVNARQAELDARQAELDARAAELEAKSKPAEPQDDLPPGVPPEAAQFFEAIGLPKEGFAPLLDASRDLDPEEFEPDEDGTPNPIPAIVNDTRRALRGMVTLVGQLMEAVKPLHQHYQGQVEVEVGRTADTVRAQIAQAQEFARSRYGIEATETEVAESLKRHLKTMLDRNGGKIPEDAATRAWYADYGYELNERKPSQGEANPAAVGRSTNPSYNGKPKDNPSGGKLAEAFREKYD